MRGSARPALPVGSGVRRLTRLSGNCYGRTATFTVAQLSAGGRLRVGALFTAALFLPGRRTSATLVSAGGRQTAAAVSLPQPSLRRRLRSNAAPAARVTCRVARSDVPQSLPL